jgi:predicted nucleic acid-binding protein
VRGILDTSVFIADEQGRSLDGERLPAEVAVSVVTLAELMLGVHLASSEQARGQRLATLRSIESAYVALPIYDEVAAAFAQLVASARRAGRRPKVQDSWIAATAHAHRAAIFTQDADFDEIPGIDVVRV